MKLWVLISVGQPEMVRLLDCVVMRVIIGEKGEQRPGLSQCPPPRCDP